MAVRPAINKKGAQSLRECLGLPDDQSKNLSFKDVGLIAIGFESIVNLKGDVLMNLNSQVGIAVLDTKNFYFLGPQAAIRTHSFCTGAMSYCDKVSKKFLFGKSLSIRRKDMLKAIESLIPRSRNVVFVGHDIRNDLHALRLLDSEYPTLIVGILDTFNLAREL